MYKVIKMFSAHVTLFVLFLLFFVTNDIIFFIL